MGSTTIHPFPELVELATREATDIQVRMGMMLSGVGVEALRAAVLAQLCDLTRPMSRYAVSVLVGNRIHWDGHSVALSVETGGINIHALFRDCGFKAEPSLNAGTDLALIVRHLWPDEARRG